MHVLSSEDLRFFEENGYLVVPDAVPPENLRAVVNAVFEFLGMDENNPDDWYRLPLTPGGMVEMYQHQALWNNRQNERVYQIFADLLQTEKLWVSIDRANLKPPQNSNHPDYDHKGFMHWDTDVSRSWNPPLRVQGVLCLTDTTPEMGGFRCVPGHHKTVKEWGQTIRPEPGTKARPDMSQTVPVALDARAGDLIIWNTLLYHGNGQNLSNKPRLAQYITMFPAPNPTADPKAYQAAREKRVSAYQERVPLQAEWVIGDTRNYEQNHYGPADLSRLGRCLLGLDDWQ